MSQQINLYNASLRERNDLLSFRNVVVAVGVSCASVALSFGYATWEKRRLEIAQAEVESQLSLLQEQAKQLTRTLAERKNDAAIAREVERLNAALAQRQTAFQVLTKGSDDTEGVAGYMRGFAKQTMDGVWLTGFKISKGDMEIRGRLLEPSLLPEYIRRLNSEPAFRGRRFAALDMKLAEADKEKGLNLEGSGLPPAPRAARSQKYLEFVLQSTEGAQATRKGAGSQ